MSVECVCVVFVAHVRRRIFFTLRKKRIRGRSTFAEDNSPVTLYGDYTELPRRCEISQSAVGSPWDRRGIAVGSPWDRRGIALGSPWDRRKMQKIVAIFFAFSPGGDVTASLRRLWRFYGVPTECYCVPAEFQLAIDCALAARSRRAHGVLGAATARAASKASSRRPLILSLKQLDVI